MRRRPSPSSSAPGADRSALVLGLGSWGARVVDVLRADGDRLRRTDTHRVLRAWNPSGPPGPDNLFQPFDAAAYLQEARHASLRQHLDPLTPQDIQTGGAELPAWGFAALHHNAAHGLLQHLRDDLDRLRATNPEGTLRCLVVGNVGEGSVAGGLTPLLLQLRSHLRLRRVDVEVWLATGEGLAANEAAQRVSDLNCAAALDTLQHVVVGDGAFTLPGTEGLREDRSEHGPVVPQVMLLSGGVDDSGHGPGVLASILANNLLCLETTSLVARLQHERDLHGEDILEQNWTDERGQRHPTRGATLHAGGVKADCMPEILHLRGVRAFIDTVTHALARSAEDKARAAALRCVEEARLGAREIIHDLELGRAPLTREEIRERGVPRHELHAFVKHRLDDDLDQLLRLAADDAATPAPYQVLVEQAQLHCHSVGLDLANAEGAWLPAAIAFYRGLEKEILRLRESAEEHGAWARREIGRSPSRDRLDRLLVRLEDDLSDHGDDLHGRFAETMTVALPIQIRKILEVAAEIREHALVVGAAPLLQRFYTALLHACESRREALQKLVFELNQVAASCARREDQVLRAARSAFTYQRGRFEGLVEALWERARRLDGAPRASEVQKRLQGDLTSLAGCADLEQRLLDAVRPDAEHLSRRGDEIMTAEPKVRHALQDALLQLHPTVELERARFGDLKTLRRRYVACTRSLRHAHADLLEDHDPVETASPWNVWIVEVEEGFPFEVVRHVAECQRAQRDAAHDVKDAGDASGNRRGGRRR